MKVKIISVIVVVVILLCGGVGYFFYQENVKQEAIDKKIEEISEVEKKFSASEKREDKIYILKNILVDMDEYSKSKDKYKEISEKYESVVSSMQGEFSKEYDASIKENTVDDIENLEDIKTINTNKDNLNELLSLIESEKKYTFSKESESEQYIQKIDSLIESYSSRIGVLEEAQKKAEEEAQKKAEEEAQKKAEEEAQKKAEEERVKTHYENEYFSVDVPADWAGSWSVEERDGSSGQIKCTIYTFSCYPQNDYGGGAMVYVLDMSDTSIPLPTYASMVPSEPDCGIGTVSNGYDEVFVTEAGAGFFSHGATITLK
ncbi:MAG: hypothetical protein HFG92_15565 [Dorea sp.]|jgi:hypothetical protein|nr:hypothetical protein [Dorea sp.]